MSRRWGRFTGSPRFHRGKTWTPRPMVVGCKNSIVASKMIFIGSPRLGCIPEMGRESSKNMQKIDSPHRYPKRMVMKGCCSPLKLAFWGSMFCFGRYDMVCNRWQTCYINKSTNSSCQDMPSWNDGRHRVLSNKIWPYKYNPELKVNLLDLIYGHIAKALPKPWDAMGMLIGFIAI